MRAIKSVSLVLSLLGASWSHAADTESAVIISIENAAAKVGERAAVVAKVAPRDGFKIAKAYRNRVIKLSAADDGVAFEREVVAGSLQDGSLVFSVGVTPKTAGPHVINGIIRFSFHDGQRMDTKSAPLIATVTGTE